MVKTFLYYTYIYSYIGYCFCRIMAILSCYISLIKHANTYQLRVVKLLPRSHLIVSTLYMALFIDEFEISSRVEKSTYIDNMRVNGSFCIGVKTATLMYFSFRTLSINRWSSSWVSYKINYYWFNFLLI